VRGEQSADVLDLRMAGLDECLDGLRALSQAFRQANAEVIENAVTAANALGRIDRCADVELLRAAVRPPEDPAARAAVDRLRTQLAEVRVLHHVGRLNEALEAIGPLVDEVRRTDYAPLLAETLFELGNLHLEQRTAVLGAQFIEEALWIAELCRHDEVVAMAAAQLVYAMGDQMARFDAAEIWAQLAETRLRRMGGREDLWGWLYNNRGAMRERQGRLQEAIEDARRAVAAKEKFHGPDSSEVGLSLSNIAMYMAGTGDLANALTYMQRGISAVEAGAGPDHPRIGVLLSNYAEILNQLGRFPEAREMAHRSLAIFEREASLDGAMLSYPLTALGLGYLGDGMADEALPPLERAVRIRDRDMKHAASLGEVHFALARALGQAGREAPRARALALAARAEYASDVPSEASQRWVAQIDAWLAADARAVAENAPVAPASRATAPGAITPARPLSGTLPS
jgi:serine/threonine-protein kinase